MPRDGSGNFNLVAGNPVVPGTTIQSSQFNATASDIATALGGSLPRNGEAGMTGPFRLADGSAAVPAFGFNGEASTGLYRPGANVLGFSVGGGERLRLLSNGNLIIGSASDLGQKLQVTGTTSITGATTLGSTLDVTGAATLAGALTGVNATFSAALSAASLGVSGAVTVGGTLGVTGLATFVAATITGAFTADGIVRTTAGDLTINASNAAGQIALSTNGATRFRIDSAGRALVGYSSNTTGQQLQVAGATSASNFVIADQTTTAAGTMGFLNSNGPAISFWGSASPGAGAMDFYSAGSVRARLDTSGRWSFGSSPPQAAVHVFGTELRLQAANAFLSGYNAGGTSQGFVQFVAGGVGLNINAENGNPLTLSTSGVTREQFSSGGTKLSTAGPSNYLSNKGSSATVTGTVTHNLTAYSNDLGAAAMSFHRAGAYAVNLGLNNDNAFELGGWSDGTTYRWRADTFGNFIARGALYPEAGAGGGYLTGNVSNIYGSMAVNGSKAGWSGLRVVSGAGHQMLMFNTTDGSGGIWDDSSTWILYNDRPGNRIGYGTSTTVGGYRHTFSGSVYLSGNLLAGGTVSQSSDGRLKTDIADCSMSIEQMLSVDPIIYTRTDTGNREVGVIAQKLREVLPMATRYDEEQDHYSVDYGRAGLIVGLSLAREVALLRAQVHELRAEFLRGAE